MRTVIGAPWRLVFVALLLVHTAPGSLLSDSVSLAQGTSGTWATRASMPTARSSLAVVTASNGKLYAIGGQSTSYLGTVEEYDPATNRWTNCAPLSSTGCASMPTPRASLAVAAASNGRLYAIGGYNGGNPLATVEEYDLATNRWTNCAPLSSSGCAPMPTARQGLAVVAASNGKLYAIGGLNGSGDLATVEEYDPATNTWAAKAPMPTPRGLLSAAPGPNGKLYAIGGSNGSGDLATVEEFTPPAGPSLVPPSPVAAATPTGTPGTTGLTAAQALAQAQGLGLTPGSGQCAPVGGACTGNAPNLQVRGTVISSMNWTVTATLPLAPASGAGQPIFVVTTTAGREAVPCGPVLPVAPAPGAQVSCAATTTGHALLGAASFLIFAGMGGAPGPAAGPALITGPGVAAASPTVPPAVAGLPVLSPPPPIILPPPPLPLIPAPPQAIAPVGLPTALGPAPEVPIIPEADSLVLLAGGLAGLVATALLRARRRR